MKNKFLPIVILIITITAATACIVLSAKPASKIDTVKLNDIRVNVEGNKHDYNKINNAGIDIIVIGFDGSVKYSTIEVTNKSYDEWLNYAYQNDCIILEFSEGRIFVFKPKDNAVKITVIVIAVFSATLIVSLVFYWLYIKKRVFLPFKDLKSFAGQVAIGNLDNPMLMDKHNAFGAFTESFDIMREELKKAKGKEIALEKSKKELVASLSHDIKTPIASIKAVSEVLALGETDDRKQKNIEIIKRKANEIDELITDMFNVTLQDLSELKIGQGMVSSNETEDIIAEADYLGKVQRTAIPECLISADKLRLQQIIGNIINNSYKYANTKINISAGINDRILSIEFIDFGGGVTDEELPLILNKFYRGKNSEGKTGAGLGLYICKGILEKMDGMIDCYNTENGFAVKICLQLA